MPTYLDPADRTGERGGVGLGVVLVVVGLVLRPVAVGAAVVAFLAALLSLGVGGVRVAGRRGRVP
ncbi:MAG TPA: hypothetical protein VJM49_20380 [Acidimicrobiales bacterium]|nr:hypothetical protein [Acidimicrobiales bacterium]